MDVITCPFPNLANTIICQWSPHVNDNTDKSIDQRAIDIIGDLCRTGFIPENTKIYLYYPSFPNIGLFAIIPR